MVAPHMPPSAPRQGFVSEGSLGPIVSSHFGDEEIKHRQMKEFAQSDQETDFCSGSERTF